MAHIKELKAANRVVVVHAFADCDALLFALFE